MRFSHFNSLLAAILSTAAAAAGSTVDAMDLSTNSALNLKVTDMWNKYSGGSAKRYYVRGNSIAQANRWTGQPHLNLKDNARRKAQLDRIASKGTI